MKFPAHEESFLCVESRKKAFAAGSVFYRKLQKTDLKIDISTYKSIYKAMLKVHTKCIEVKQNLFSAEIDIFHDDFINRNISIKPDASLYRF